jgi:extracellular factor (EF) 3-hydroxypalmitic acid methyl ester biosynthesis protein
LGSGYELIYCSGLFDYFSDRVCRQLVAMYYEWLAPGGRLVVANMNDEQKPFRRMVEYLLDWRLIYRDGPCMESFVPAHAPRDSWAVFHEPALANLFLEVRKPPEA